MQTNELGSTLAQLFGELVDGAPEGGAAFILNSGDAGLLRSLDKLSAADASRTANGSMCPSACPRSAFST